MLGEVQSRKSMSKEGGTVDSPRGGRRGGKKGLRKLAGERMVDYENILVEAGC